MNLDKAAKYSLGNTRTIQQVAAQVRCSLFVPQICAQSLLFLFRTIYKKSASNSFNVV